MNFPLENILGIISALDKAGITNKYLQAGILATTAKETGIKPIRENLNYISASRLMFVWPNRFPTIESATPYVNNPEKLANFVYGGRAGNGQQEGYKFRGAGYNGLTFRSNYERYSKLTGIELTANPDILNSPQIAAKVLAAFYKDMLTRTNIAKYTLDHSADINNLDSGVRIAVAITAGLPSTTGGNIYREGLSKASVFAPELLAIVESKKKSSKGLFLPIMLITLATASYFYFKK